VSLPLPGGPGGLGRPEEPGALGGPDGGAAPTAAARAATRSVRDACIVKDVVE